jgi:glycerol-3-phosphate acyltransferase PlsY
MEYLISGVIGYLLGSIPTAYLILKKSKGIDITQVGSGNVGAMNSYEVTNSKGHGFSVFIIDFLKGFFSVLILLQMYNSTFIFPAIALLFAVFSHCFNPWISFKGGRGLATAAGGSVLLFPFILLAWIVLWILVYFLKKDILLANIIATPLSLIITLLMGDYALKFVYISETVNTEELILFAVSVLLIIFIKHVDPLKEIMSNNKEN